MILVITIDGRTTEHSFVLGEEGDLDDTYLRSLAEEVRGLPRGALRSFIVERMPTPAGEMRAFLRPRPPFVGTLHGRQMEIAVEALLQYSTSSVAGDRARAALAEIAALEEVGDAS